MRYGVNRQVLLLTAGVVWIVAGANILRIGIATWFGYTANNPSSDNWLAKVGETSVVFRLFFFFVFKKLYYKHTQRIEQKRDKNCPFSFFDAKGWVIMTFMITLGITIRKLHLLPDAFISVFYTGLSLALIVTGILFLRHYYYRYRRV